MSDRLAQHPDDSPAHVTTLKHRAYTEIETVRGKIRTRTLFEVYGDNVANRSTIQH